MLGRTRTELENSVRTRNACLQHINVLLEHIRLTATFSGKKEAQVLENLNKTRRNYIEYCDKVSTLNDQLARISARIHKLHKQ